MDHHLHNTCASPKPVLDTLCVEMDTHLKVKGKWRRGRKKYKGVYYYDKPYWTKELSEQWRKI